MEAFSNLPQDAVSCRNLPQSAAHGKLPQVAVTCRNLPWARRIDFYRKQPTSSDSKSRQVAARCRPRAAATCRNLPRGSGACIRTFPFVVPDQLVRNVNVRVLDVRARGIQVNPASGKFDEWGRLFPSPSQTSATHQQTDRCGQRSGSCSIITLLQIR